MPRTKIFLIFLITLSLTALIVFRFTNSSKLVSPVSYIVPTPTVKPLLKYSFENLKAATFSSSNIFLDTKLDGNSSFSSYFFFFETNGKKVSGLANFPAKKGVYPVIVQFRGYIDPQKYQTGAGTIRSGQVFAQNGFITLAPDFLGYGKSSAPSTDPLEERFETYTTALTLLSSLPNLNKALENIGLHDIEADTNKVGIWGHSNGGHIALSVTAIIGKSYPLVLWNPVSKPFPYSILYYSDELPDNGKKLRKMIADFEKDYDIENYSPPNYYKWINAPIQLHQAIDDEAVPKKWSDELYNNLKNLDKEITYYTYPGDNHDFNRGSWSQVVERNIQFYKNYFSSF